MMTDISSPPRSDRAASFASPDDRLAQMDALLSEHAVSLDGIFADFTTLAAEKMAHSPGIAQAYLKLALRAQASCRASLEALARADRVSALAAAAAVRQRPAPAQP